MWTKRFGVWVRRAEHRVARSVGEGADGRLLLLERQHPFPPVILDASNSRPPVVQASAPVPVPQHKNAS